MSRRLVVCVVLSLWALLAWAASAQAHSGDQCVVGTWVWRGTVENPSGEVDLPGLDGPSLTLNIPSPLSGDASILLDTQSPIYHRPFDDEGVASYRVTAASDRGARGDLLWESFTGMPLIGMPGTGPESTGFTCGDATLGDVTLPETISPQAFDFTRFGPPTGPFIRGQKLEGKVLEEERLVKNGSEERCFGGGEVRIASNGSRWRTGVQGGFSIPDAFTHNCRDIVEIKSSRNIYNSRQFRRYEEWATRKSGCVNLVITPYNRTVSLPLQQAIAECGGTIRIRLGASRYSNCVPPSPECVFDGNRLMLRSASKTR